MVLDGFLWFPLFLYGFNDVVDDLHNCFDMFNWLSRLLVGTSLVAPAGQLPHKHGNDAMRKMTQDFPCLLKIIFH